MNNGKRTFEVESECADCKGTGLYVGFAEHDGAAVVCRKCKGTGHFYIVFSYTPFTQKRFRKDITRVLEANPGIMVKTTDDLKLSDFGGMPYDDWARGQPFPARSEMRKYICPGWWYQCVHNDKQPNYDECRGGQMFSQCKEYENKDLCWSKWDEEFGDNHQGATP